MDWLQFFSSVVGSIAWPAAVVGLAILVREPLVKLIPRVRAVKYGDLHIDIADQLEAMKEQVDAANNTATVEPEKPTLSFRALAEADPRAAVLSAWLPVEVELNQIALKSGLELVTGMSSKRQLGVLQSKGVLDQFTVDTLVNLRRIRNTAVHVTDESIDVADALKMGEMCQWLSAQLKRINASLTHDDTRASTRPERT